METRFLLDNLDAIKTGSRRWALAGHHLGDAPDEPTAVRLVSQAVDRGITFFDNSNSTNREARLAHGFPLDMQQVEVREMLKMTDNSGHPFPPTK